MRPLLLLLAVLPACGFDQSFHDDEDCSHASPYPAGRFVSRSGRATVDISDQSLTLTLPGGNTQTYTLGDVEALVEKSVQPCGAVSEHHQLRTFEISPGSTYTNATVVISTTSSAAAFEQQTTTATVATDPATSEIDSVIEQNGRTIRIGLRAHTNVDAEVQSSWTLRTASNERIDETVTFRVTTDRRGPFIPNDACL